MNKKRKISLALTFVMAFNLFAIPVLASASQLNENKVINGEQASITSIAQTKLDLSTNYTPDLSASSSGETKAITGPKLDLLEVSAATIQSDGSKVIKQKVLVREDGSVDFDSNKLEYGLYLRSIDTDEISVYVHHSDTQALSIKVGNETETSVKPGDMHKVTVKLTKVANESIPVVVANGTKNTTYVIKVFKPATAELDPHIFAELETQATKQVLGLNVYAVNADVLSFSLTVRLDDTFQGGAKAFEGFSDNSGIIFNDLNKNLAKEVGNYLNLDSRFKIAEMKSDGTLLHLTIDAKSTTVAVNIGVTPEKIITVNLKRSGTYTGNITQEIETLILDEVQKADSTYGNNLYSKSYGDMNDTVATSNDADKETLSYLQYSAKVDTIRMHINYGANPVGRVKYEIVDVSDPNNKNIVIAEDLVDKEIKASVIQGVYVVRLLADGYLLAESDNIVYDGNPSKFGIIITPVKLIEGDLDSNGSIDGQDRIKLLSILNKNVIVAGSGFVENGTEEIYADYNDDDSINALDLGLIIQNMGKTYSPIHKK